MIALFVVGMTAGQEAAAGDCRDVGMVHGMATPPRRPEGRAMARTRQRWLTYEKGPMYPESRIERLLLRRRTARVPARPRRGACAKVGRCLTYDADPLFPDSRRIRLLYREMPEAPLRPPRPEKPSYRKGPKIAPFMRRDTVMWRAIRKDRARGLPRRLILELYGVNELEYDRALRAGQEA